MKKLSLLFLSATALVAQSADAVRTKAPLLDLDHILAVLVYSVLGIVIMVLTFVIIDWISPRDLWGEIADKQNRATAILFAGLLIGISIIIAAALVG